MLISERVEHINRIKGLLFSQGISSYEALRRDRRQRLEELRTGDGGPLPTHLKTQISRELDRLELLLEQIGMVEAERDAMLAAQPAAAPASAGRMLRNFKGVGPEFAAILWLEALFRHFDNRRQIASYAGLAPTPWQSGSVDREQGVSKAGNRTIASHAHRTRLAMAAPSAAIGAGSLVQRTGHSQRRSHEKDADCRARAQASGGAMEICHRRRRHRGSCHESRPCLTTNARHEEILKSSRT